MTGDVEPIPLERLEPASGSGFRRFVSGVGGFGGLPLLVFLVLVAACGGRSPLPACAQPGETRPCESGCGSGFEVCVGGQWQACQVPVMSRPCQNGCGQGTQTCEDGTWSVCRVLDVTRACATPCGQGQQDCVDGGWGLCEGPQLGPPSYTAAIWDFTTAHPDFGFDGGIGLDPGIVETNLGPDDKPVYASDASTPTTHGAFYFNEWYRDTRGPNPGFDAGPVNETTTIPLSFAPWTSDPTVYAYDNDSFFPVDGELFGNEGLHNYYFTLELIASFRYTGGETFRFTSDDDSWAFLNGKLAVDLGGIHPATSKSVALDDVSQELGLVKGQTYRMHLFFADRRVVDSVLRVDLPAVDVGVCSGAMP
jgi:fibro-slime domain-containing protein